MEAPFGWVCCKGKLPNALAEEKMFMASQLVGIRLDIIRSDPNVM